MPKVSIIVPVYNAEKVIERCIKSILKQTCRDFELILVDDGSTDSSGKLCDLAAEEDGRVRVIHKENGGVSAARNQALAMAKGEYVQFLDADDWIIENATELFVRAMEEHDVDMVISDFYRVNGDLVSKKGAIEADGRLSIREFAGELMERPADFYYGVLWNKFFKRSVLQEYSIRMDETISWCEDFIFNLEYLRHCKTIFALKVPLYYYVKTEGSLAGQGMSVKNTVHMKQIVFKYYASFCLEVFGKEGYEKRRLQIYRYFVDPARDGLILPSVFPTTVKLGEERENISEAVYQGEGKYFSLYRERKLQDKLFEVVALRNGLEAEDIKLLYFIGQGMEALTADEVMEIMNLTYSKLSLSLWKLRSEGLITLKKDTTETDFLKKWFFRDEMDEAPENEETRRSRLHKAMKTYTLTVDAEIISNEILFVWNDFEAIQFEGFTEEEKVLYEELERRRQENIKKALF